MTRILRPGLCALLAITLVACGQSAATPAARAPSEHASVESPSRPAALPVLPVVLAVPSAPGAPRDRLGAQSLGPAFDGPEVIELPASSWELPQPLRMRPLSQLSPEAARFLASRDGAVTAGVFVPGENAIYVASPELGVPMASVSKLVIMIALFEQAEASGRPLSQDEVALLEPMVVWSDNESATLLWDSLGGATGVEASLAARDVRGVVLHPVAWGDSWASGPAVAWLLGRLAFGDLVAPEHRDLALRLLARATSEQSWGVGASAGRSFAGAAEGTIIGVKDGWYPVDAGWRAGSAGLIVPGAGSPATIPYSIAVLTAENRELEDGIATIEGLADRIQAALTPRGAG